MTDQQAEPTTADPYGFPPVPPDPGITSGKMFDRVGKLLAQAEGASNEAERDTYMEKAMALAQANMIDMALARAKQLDKTKVEQITQRRIKVGDYRRTNNKYFGRLYDIIAGANDVRVTFAGDIYCTGHGFPSDLDVVERLFMSLSVQMVHDANQALKRGANKEVVRAPKQRRVEIPDEERAWGEPINEDAWNSDRYYADSEAQHEYWPERYPLPPKFRLEKVRDEEGRVVYEEQVRSTIDGRLWRTNFYDAFISRIQAKLWEARRQARKNAGIVEENESDSRAVAIRDKTQEVDKAFDEYLEKRQIKGTWEPPTPNAWDGNAREAGAQAAERANMGAEAGVEHVRRGELT